LLLVCQLVAEWMSKSAIHRVSCTLKEFATKEYKMEYWLKMNALFGCICYGAKTQPNLSSVLSKQSPHTAPRLQNRSLRREKAHHHSTHMYTLASDRLRRLAQENRKTSPPSKSSPPTTCLIRHYQPILQHQLMQ